MQLELQEEPKIYSEKTMSIPDTLIYKYFELCTKIKGRFKKIKTDLENGINPRDLKEGWVMRLWKCIMTNETADKTVEEFDKVFINRNSDDIPEMKIEEDKNETQRILLYTGLYRFKQ